MASQGDSWCRIGSARARGCWRRWRSLGFLSPELLRQLRAEARLTQEELAEAAGLSPRSVSDLERGIHRTAHKDTAVLLADALGLAGPVRGLFVAAARGAAPAAEVLAARQRRAPGAFAAAATRTLPRDIAAFTGRQAELAQLLGAIDGAGRRRRGGGHSRDRRDGRDRQDHLRGARGAPARRSVSRMGSSSCRCTPTPPGSGRLTPPMRWPACC